MTSLDELLNANQVDDLGRHWITSVDDLFAALCGDPAAVQQLLALSDEDLVDLKQRVTSATSPEVREAVATQAATPRVFGAWVPDD